MHKTLTTLLPALALFVGIHDLSAQGWYWHDSMKGGLETVFLDSDSTFVCTGDSGHVILWKRFDLQGNLLAQKQAPAVSTYVSVSAHIKKDFGLLYLSRYVQSTSWSTYYSYNIAQAMTDDQTNFMVQEITGENSNDYYLYDAALTPDSALLMVGQHLNPDENKLYITKRYTAPNHPGYWTKEIHDSTKQILALRIFPAPAGGYLIFASRYSNTLHISEIGFLHINDAGDLLESFWVPDSGFFNPGYYDRNFPIEADQDGFTWVADGPEIYRFDKNGQLLWSKKIQYTWSSHVDFYSVKRISDGFVLVGQFWVSGLSESAEIVKLDAQGELLWNRRYDFNTAQNFTDVAPLADGSFIAVGRVSTLNVDYFTSMAARLNPDGSIFNNYVRGKAFLDQNGNCQRDPGEQPVNSVKLSFDNSYFPVSMVTDTSGAFSFISDTGQYKLAIQAPPGAYWQLCEDTLLGKFAAYNTADTLDIPIQTTELCPQMSISLESERIRPCRFSQVSVHWVNEGTLLADSAQAILTLPAGLSIVQSTLPYAPLGNNEYLFHTGPASPGASGQFSVTVHNDCSLQLGDTLCLQARIMPDMICQSQPDSSLFYFSASRCLPVRTSFDPNEKEAYPPGKGDDHFIASDETLTYLIRFQNTGNDTAATITIRDTLSEYLDPQSVVPEIASHPYRFEYQDDRSLKFVFDNVSLPDSNINEAASHGFVRFRVKPKPGLLPKTEIANRAGIYFDFNPVVLTNKVSRVIEPLVRTKEIAGAGVLSVFPNPASGKLQVEATDHAGAGYCLVDMFGSVQISGVRSVDDHRLEIDISKLPRGTYVLRLEGCKPALIVKI